jgi:hypothetical protein
MHQNTIANSSRPYRPSVARAVLVLACLACAQNALAALVFFDNTPGPFNTAASIHTLLGTENFEEPSLGALPNDSAAIFFGPLAQSSTTAPYNSGITLPMTVRTIDPINNTPEHLVAFRNHMTISSTVVLANAAPDTVDWVFEPSTNVIAVGLNPVTFSGSNVTRQMTVNVFDTSDAPLGAITINSNDAGTGHLGILASGASRIGRINFRGFTPSGSNASEGADNATLYVQAIPEPATLITAAACLVILFAAWRKY